MGVFRGEASVERGLRAGAFAVALGVMWLGGPVRAEESKAYPVDISANLDEEAIVKLGQQIGPVLLHEVLLQDHPTAEELREADADDTARPTPLLVVDCSASSTVLDLTIELQDEAGKVVASCSGVKTEGKGEWRDLVELCRKGPELRTADWPRVKVVRIVGTVKARD